MTKEELYENNKFLVKKVIKDMKCRYRTEEEFEEYVFWGTLGLVKAINGYNENVISSSSYFYTSIKNSILVLYKRRTSHKRAINYTIMESLDTPLSDEAHYTELHEIIPDEKVHIEEDIIRDETYKALYKAISKLKPEQQEIICNYFGIKRNQKSLESMAKEYGVTRQAVAVKKDNAVRDLRKILIRMGEFKND